MKFLALFAVAAIALASGQPRVIYTKSFPGSVPAYVSITVERSGEAAYKQAPDDDPERFQLDADTTAAIFDLAEKLNHFNQPLESGLKIANMGVKTFRWENGSEAGEAKFNYSLDENAKALHDLFERITETEGLFAAFDRAIRHDRLGVNDALVNIQNCWDKKRLVATQQFLPLLDQVAGKDTFMHMDREKAAQLAGAIRAGKSKAQ